MTIFFVFLFFAEHVFKDKQTIYYNNKLTTTPGGGRGEAKRRRKGGGEGGEGGLVFVRSDLTMNDSVHGKEGFLGVMTKMHRVRARLNTNCQSWD